MRVFLAGIMQGSIVHDAVHEQSYRGYLSDLLVSHVPGVDVFDPWAAYPDSLDYDDVRVQEVLVANIGRAAVSDLVIAYLPQASMGTALEIWEAWRAGVPVIVISPLAMNWVVRTCATHHFTSLGDFAALVQAGELPQLIDGLTVARR